MSLNIKNPEAHALAAAVARGTGQSLTAAVVEALREKLQRLGEDAQPGLAEDLLRIGRDCAGRLPRPVRQIDHGELLYDDKGLPR